MAIADATQKNIVENTAAAGDELEQLNTKTDQVKALQESLLAESERGNNILAKSFGLDEDEIRRQKEKDAKAARASDGGGSLGPSPGGKGKGIFGLLGSMFKVLGGGFLKILGPIWKVLKIMFKGLGFIAIGAGLLAGLAFFQKDAKGQEEMINNVISFFKGVGDALKKFGSIFSGSFMEGMDDVVNESGKVEKEGLGTKFKKFGEAWGKVIKQISEISIGEYKGLDGVARFMGDMLNKVAGWLVDVGTGIAELITNPHETLAKMQVKIESFFLGIADMLGRVFDKFFNMEFILSMLPQEFVPDSLQESVSKARVKEKQKRIKQLNQNDINTQNRLDSAQKQLEAEQKLGDKADATKLRNLTLSIERAKMDLEANKKQKEYLKEQMLASQENVIQEKLNQRIKQITGVDNQVELEKIQKMEERAKELREKNFDTSVANSWDFNKMNLASAAKIQKQIEALTGKQMSYKTQHNIKGGYAFGDAGVDVDFIKSVEGQKLIGQMISMGQVEAGFGSAGEEAKAVRIMNQFFGKTLQAQSLAAEEEQKAAAARAKLEKIKLDKLEAVGGEKKLREEIIATMNTGGPILKTGLYKLHANELVMDNNAVQVLDSAVKTGLILTNLQRQKLDSGSGAQNIIIQDNSVRSSNQNQPMILPPSPIEPGNSQSPGLLN